MLIDLHLRTDKGAPGPLVATIDARPIDGKIMLAGKHHVVLTGVRAFVVISKDDYRAIKEFNL